MQTHSRQAHGRGQAGTWALRKRRVWPPNGQIMGCGRRRAGLSVQRRGGVAGAKWQRDWGTQQQTRPRIRSLILRQPGSHHRHCPRDCDPGRQGRGLSRDPAARAPQTQSPRLRASPEAPSAGPACPPGRCVTRPSSPRPPGRHCKPGRSASLEGQAGALPSPQRASRRIGVWPCPAARKGGVLAVPNERLRSGLSSPSGRGAGAS